MRVGGTEGRRGGRIKNEYVSWFFSMIKCRQGGAARLKFIIVLGCMSVEWVSEGGLQRRRKKSEDVG